MSNSKDAVRKILDSVKADKRTSLTAPEGKLVCDACGIPVPKEGVAKSASDAARIATEMGFPVVMKIVSPDILHKTEAGGVMVGVKTAAVRIVVDFDYKPRPAPRSNEEIVAAMNRIMQPKAVAVIGASAEDGKIGNSVMKNLINGGYKGEIYPIHPKAPEILG